MWRFYSKISTDTENGTGLTVWQICISKKSSLSAKAHTVYLRFFFIFSVGLENIEDLIKDFEQAFEKIKHLGK